MITDEKIRLGMSPELLDELRQQRQRLAEIWASMVPVFAARTAALAAAALQMQPALEAARAAAPALAAANAVIAGQAASGARLLEGLRRAYAPNWDVGSIRLRTVRTIVDEDGIPIVWVPRSGIVAELMSAASRDERLAILEDHYGEIISDCDVCLGHCSALAMAVQTELAKRAVAAYAAGMHEAGQALAVVIAERIITDYLGSYARAKQQAKFDVGIMMEELRRAAAIAPIVRFYTEWYPSSGQPAPTDLSRHVSVHHPTLQQYSRSNSLLAVMLVVSLLREVTEWGVVFGLTGRAVIDIVHRVTKLYAGARN